MSGLSLTFDLTDTATPRLRTFLEGMGDRTRLHEAIGKEEANLIHDYLIMIAVTRHDTAERLGATPTGHWAQAADKTTFDFDSSAATVTVEQPGIGRAAHDVEIAAEPGHMLTIPQIAAAYGVRAYSIWDSEHLFIPKGKNVIASANPDGTLTVWYSLVASVMQRQDRTLLPPEEQLKLTALEGTQHYVHYLLWRHA